MPNAAIVKFESDTRDRAVREAMEFIDWTAHVTPGARVFIKPNLTYPFYKAGVTTSPEMIESVVRLLVERTDRISIGESDGGSHAWTADAAFEGHGFGELVQRYGVTLVNLSRVPSEVATARVGRRTVQVRLPSPLLHETDVFITMPVPKVHVMTGVSLAFKNQWGVMPDVKRLQHHYDFPHHVLAINQLVRTRLCVFDGTYFLDRTGPMDGDAIRMELVIASDDPGAGSLVCCEIMGVDPDGIEQLRLARAVGMMPRSLAEVRTNADPASFRQRRFRLERTLLNRVALLVFKSRWATAFAYNSPFAGPLHEALYLVRGRPKDMAPRW